MPTRTEYMAAAGMRAALKALLDHDVPHGPDVDFCHIGICPRHECARCQRANAAVKALAKAEGR